MVKIRNSNGYRYFEVKTFFRIGYDWYMVHLNERFHKLEDALKDEVTTVSIYKMENQTGWLKLFRKHRFKLLNEDLFYCKTTEDKLYDMSKLALERYLEEEEKIHEEKERKRQWMKEHSQINKIEENNAYFEKYLNGDE